MEAQEKILKTALQLFFKYGIKHVTMDDIAKELGMSKKTIYQFFKEKDDLINQLTEQEFKLHEKEFNDINRVAEDPLHEIMLISEKMKLMMQSINPMFFMDLQKFYPAAYQRFKQFRNECAFQNVLSNIKRGVHLGIYRSEIDIDFAAKYRLSQIDMIMFGEHFTYEKTSFAKANQCLLEMFIYGICTLKGHKLFNSYKKIKEEE